MAAQLLRFAGKRVMSGIQPTAGAPHIGNYFGALANWAALANNSHQASDVIFSIVDLHALTTLARSPNDWDLATASRDMAAAIIGCGVDPEKCVLYRQSHVMQHTELAWILNCLATPAQMERMTQFKDKIKNDKSVINMGLFSYPILQAADILLYRSELVPVGNDQWQHIELTRNLAQRLNNAMRCPSGSGYFAAPETLTLEVNARVRSLTDASDKMSKSHPLEASRINLTDSADAIEKKIKRVRLSERPQNSDATELQRLTMQCNPTGQNGQCETMFNI